MPSQLLNVFIYDNSRKHRLKLENIARNYAEENNIDTISVLSTTRPNKILSLSFERPGLYFLNIDALEKKMNGIQFASEVRKHDIYGSIVFLTEQDIFADGPSDLAGRTIRSHISAMSFLPKDSAEYEKEIKECITAHVRKAGL